MCAILHNAIPKEESPPDYTCVRLHNCACGSTLQHAIPKEESLPHYSCVGLASCGSVIRKLTCHNQELQRSKLNKCLIKINREIELSGTGAAEVQRSMFFLITSIRELSCQAQELQRSQINDFLITELRVWKRTTQCYS